MFSVSSRLKPDPIAVKALVELRKAKDPALMAAKIREFSARAWPQFDWHRWATMMLDEIVKGGTIATWGPASSSKTATAAIAILSLYWAHYDHFTGLASTTDRERLELRIWGEIKMRFKQARKRHPWLRGNMMDSKQRICTDPKDESDGRDFRNGVLGIACKRGNEWQGLGDYSGTKNAFVMLIADECFPAGTMIDTPNGKRPIETFKIGDEIFSAAGRDHVVGTSRRTVWELVCVIGINGTKVSCTPNHPFLTQYGWVRAGQLTQSHYMLSGYEAMCVLQSSFAACHQQRQVLYNLQKQGANLRKLRAILQAELSCGSTQILYSPLRCPASAERSCLQEEVLHTDQGEENWSGEKAVVHRQPGRGEENQSEIVSTESHAEQSDSDQGIQDTKSNGMEAGGSWRQRARSNESREDSSLGVSERCLPVELLHQNWTTTTQFGTLSFCLQGGRGVSSYSTSHRGGWPVSLCALQTKTGRKETKAFGGTWVDRIEIQKYRNHKSSGRRNCAFEVFNLQIEHHPTYSAFGLSVHNCHLMQPGFLQGAQNLKSNNNAGQFTGIFMGNLVDIETPLGEAAEPDCGWDALPDSEASRVYRTKFLNGRAIQLVGKDSPNFDYPEGKEPYPYLIGRRFIEELKHDCGEGSPLYIAQAGGTIPRSSLAKRILTKEICLKYNAHDPVIWGHTPLTKLYAMDLSYNIGHGDKTVGLPMAFGLDIEGKLRLACLDRAKIYGVPRLSGAETVEDALAAEAKEQMDQFGIPYSHFFFDGTGRSSFTAAAMKIIGTVIQPIEFGGRASERPNFMGRKWPEGVLKGELMPCSRIFTKFVSELWFAWRYAVEADQIRALPEDVARDGCARLWDLVAGNKLDVEPKASSGSGPNRRIGMKERIGRSPDHGDAFSCGLEGARRLGFVIGKPGVARNAHGVAWLQSVKRDYDQIVREQELTYT